MGKQAGEGGEMRHASLKLSLQTQSLQRQQITRDRNSRVHERGASKEKSQAEVSNQRLKE